MIQYSLHAQVLELRALHQDGREVHVPVAINNSELGPDPFTALEVLERRIGDAKRMTENMFAARPEPETKEELRGEGDMPTRGDVYAAIYRLPVHSSYHDELKRHVDALFDAVEAEAAL